MTAQPDLPAQVQEVQQMLEERENSFPRLIREKWINACADAFQRKGRNVDRGTAMALAETAYSSGDYADEDGLADPEEAAAIEMSYWED